MAPQINAKNAARKPFTNLRIVQMNIGSIALTGAVLVGGLITTYLWKQLMKEQMKHVAAANDQSYFPSGRQTSKLSFEMLPSFFPSFVK